MKKVTGMLLSVVTVLAMVLGSVSVQPFSTANKAFAAENNVLNVSELDAATLSAETKIGAFTVLADEKNTVVIDANGKKSEDGAFEFSKRMKLGGAGTAQYRSIKIDVTAATKITAYAMSSSSGEDRKLALFDADFNQLADGVAYGKVTDSCITPIVYNVDKAGTYYLASVASGINVYFLAVGDFSFEAAKAEVKEETKEEPKPEVKEEPASDIAAAPVSSVVTEAVTYDFRDGSIIPTDTNGKNDVTFGALTVKVGTKNAYQYNGAQHGVAFKAGNSVSINVSGPVKVFVGDCQYSKLAELTLKSVDGTYSETATAKTGCFHNDGSQVEFTYKGAATTLVIDFENTTYVPVITVQPVVGETPHTYDFRDGSVIPTTTDGKQEVTSGNLTVKVGTKNAYQYNGAQHGVAFKAGNSIEIKVSGPTTVTVGDCKYSNATALTLKSADGSYSKTVATKTGCFHNDGSALTFDYEGGATTLILEFDNTAYVPIITTDAYVNEGNNAVKDSMVIYNLADGVVFPNTYTADNKLDGSVSSADGLVKFSSKGMMYFHDKDHGIAISKDDVIEVDVAGDATVNFTVCMYGGKEGQWKATTKKGEILGTAVIPAVDTSSDGVTYSVKYTGPATTIKFVLGNEASASQEYYLHNVEVFNAPEEGATIGNGKLDVWDFGAEKFDEAKYNNKLTVDIINGFTPNSKPGTSGVTVLSFGTEDIFFNTSGKTNTRIRTSNTEITRYDDKHLLFTDGEQEIDLTGCVFSNSGNNPRMYLAVKLYANDNCTFYLGANNGDSNVIVEGPNGKILDTTVQKTGTKLSVSASESGIYKIYSVNEKLVVYRVVREHTNPVTLSGKVDAPAALTTCKLAFKNLQTGIVEEVVTKDGAYSFTAHSSFSYEVSVKDANGYIVKSEPVVSIARDAESATFDVKVEKVATIEVTGKIKGLNDVDLAKLKLSFVNKAFAYVPELIIDGAYYVAQFETGVTYDVVAEGVNDYFIASLDQLIADLGEYDFCRQDITFAKWPVQEVTLVAKGLPEDAVKNVVYTLTNINDTDYVYTVKAGEKINLRNGQYRISANGISDISYALAPTADVIVRGEAVTADVNFAPITTWDFSKLNKGQGGPGISSVGEQQYFNGIVIGAQVAENKSYLLINTDGEIKVPAKAGQKLTLSYCYCAGFCIDGNAEYTVDEKSGSTSQIDSIEYIVPETCDGFVTIKAIAGTNSTQTYFTSISVVTPVAYAEKVTVGKDKQFATINDALKAVALMDRKAADGTVKRVEVVIDPGNYEEMLNITLENISLVNAAGDKASLELLNKGVDIAENAVRITGYYGHGYSYYSMGSDYFSNDEILAVNKANGSKSVINPGAGSVTYWNATVIVGANGFEADGIIFENSFNQYISAKEAADVVVAETGNKGIRPTTVGDTSVQSRKFVERAGALSIKNKVQQVYFKNCKFVGRQDTLYGGVESTVAFDHCSIYGAVDFIYGGMTAVFNECDLVMNTDDKTSSDEAYLTAAQQASTRGYLMLNCTVKSTKPGIDTASEKISKPGYFGRPWAGQTSEVVFYNTTIETTDFNGETESLIKPVAWTDSLGGAAKMYEFGTKELAGVDNSEARIKWSTVLKEAVLNDGTDISTPEKAIKAFLGSWNPFN